MRNFKNELELFPMGQIDFTYYITGRHISNNKLSTKYNVSNILNVHENGNLQVFKKYYENTKQIKYCGAARTPKTSKTFKR